MTGPNPTASALETAVVFIDLPGRVRLRIKGPDRLKFLHNLTTNDIKRRAAGTGCEAFVTSLQGKTLGYVRLLVFDDAVLLRTEAAGLSPVLPHFQKYGALDEIELIDETARTFEHHLAGPKAAAMLSSLGVSEPPPEGDLNHTEATIAGAAVRIVRESPLGRPGFTLIGDATDAGAVVSAVIEAGKDLGLVMLSPESFDALRIEAGTPEAGRDVTEVNLPQEVARDDRAINFVKGCYLGQETVARIDALGHVNKLLRGLRIEADTPPPPGSSLVAGDKEVGRITSSAVSERTGRPIGLAYVRTAIARPGSAVSVRLEGGEEVPAVVSALPMIEERDG